MFRVDDVQHLMLGFIVTAALGWPIGAAVHLTVEGYQIDEFRRAGNNLEDYWWGDTATDLLWGAVGIGLGEVIHAKRHDKRRKWDNCEEFPGFPGFYICADDSTMRK